MTIVRIGSGAAGALAVGAAIAALAGSGTVLSLLTQAVVYAVFASGVGLLLRQNGMVSFGHALYFGVSGYIMGIVLELGWIPAELAIVATLAAVALFAFVVGLVIVRVPGVAFSMMTLAIGQMFYLTASRSRGLTGGADRMNISWPAELFGLPQSVLLQPAVLFLICWCAMVLVVAGLALVPLGRIGRGQDVAVAVAWLAGAGGRLCGGAEPGGGRRHLGPHAVDDPGAARQGTGAGVAAAATIAAACAASSYSPAGTAHPRPITP